MGRERSKADAVVDASTVNQLVQASVYDLFHRLGCPLKEGESFAPSELCGVASIPFTIPQRTGVLSLGANRQLLVDSQGLQSYCKDWIGELSNLVMGGVKFKLLQLGAEEVHLGTPTIYPPTSRLPAKAGGTHLRFTASVYVLEVVLDATAVELIEQLALTASGQAEAEDVLEAGELLFF